MISSYFKLILSVLVFGVTAQAQQQDYDIDTKILNNLRFSNRAQCAEDSKKPTGSIFLFIDGYNAGKIAHSAAKLTGQNPEEFSKLAMKEFRLSVSYLTIDIIQKMSKGQLPILPAEYNKSNLNQFAKAANACQGQVNCPDLNEYLSYLWNNAGKRSGLNQIDNFSPANYLPEANHDRIGCYYVKKFSALQGHLQSDKPTIASLNQLAVSYLNDNEYIANCFDNTDEIDSRNATIQIDWATNQQLLDQKGFDFWNSLKIYLAWSWRYSSFINEFSPTYSELFRSIALEESILLSPNGCKSILKPTCDSEFLSINSAREFAKVSMNSFEHSKLVPANSGQELLNKGVRAVNNDFLGTTSYDSASAWLANFRKNLVQGRGLIKNKYQTAMINLALLNEGFSAERLGPYVAKLRSYKFASDAATRDSLYYLCTELRLVGDDRLDFLRSSTEQIAELKNIQNMQWSDRISVPQAVDYFLKLNKAFLPVCDELEKVQYWNTPNYTVDKNGFMPWAKEVLQIPITGTQETSQDKLFNITRTLDPVLTVNSPLSTKSSLICGSAIDCIRLTIKSVIDLYATATYAESVMPISKLAASPSIFNPYAELTACKIYDPWFESNRVKHTFMVDMTSAILFGWNFLPVYIESDKTPATVTSFNQLIKDNKIQFDPNIDKEKTLYSLMADFGPLAGAPCAVSLNNAGLPAFHFYALSGITLNYCDAKQGKDLISSNKNEVSVGAGEKRAICAGCSLNFTAVASAATAGAGATGFNPAKLVVYVFRAFSKLFDSTKNNINIPKNWEVNPQYVSETYKKYNGIPEKCLRQLTSGLRCYENICAAKVAKYIEETYQTKVTNISLEDVQAGSTNQTAWVKTQMCAGDIVVKFQCAKNTGDFFKVNPSRITGFQKSCRTALEGNK